MEGEKLYVMFVTTLMMSTIPLVNLTTTDSTPSDIFNSTTPTMPQMQKNKSTTAMRKSSTAEPTTVGEIKTDSSMGMSTTAGLHTETAEFSSSPTDDRLTTVLQSVTDLMTALESATRRYEVFYSKNESSTNDENAHETEKDLKENATDMMTAGDVATFPSVHDSDTTTSNDSTRLPKKVKTERYLEERVRPARPDPGYAGNSEFIRPYRPDSNQYPYFRPTPDYRAPIIRQDSTSESSTSEQERAVTSTPPQYRPSANRPYIPQGGFGRPYRPDYQRPSPVLMAERPSTLHDLAEHSRADYDFTRQSESLPSYSKPPMGSNLRPNSEASIYGPGYNSLIDSSSEDPSGYSNYAEVYPGIETGSKPFSSGTVTSAKNLTRVEFIKADCFENHMKVSVRFNGSFEGLVYSSGYAQDAACSYVNGSGRNHYDFYIRLNRCGTLGQQQVDQDPTKKRRAQYLVNTVTVQYNPIIEEDIDEHFRVTCEYGSDFWKTVTFPMINVESAAVKLRTGTPVVFTLPPPQCNMEVRSGFGPSGSRITGPVSIGDPITLFIHMKSESAGFDILVSNCFAHNGGQKRLQLIDSHGCVLQEKLITPFRGDQSQQTSLYAYLKAFRFTGSPALYLECDVHMCHGSCPPQRCYWRNKRDAPEVNETESVISESVSLFQALEVRHEEAPHAQKNIDTESLVCLRTAGFAAVFALLLLLLLSTIAVACICNRRSKDTDSFLQFPLKSTT